MAARSVESGDFGFFDASTAFEAADRRCPRAVGAQRGDGGGSHDRRGAGSGHSSGRGSEVLGTWFTALRGNNAGCSHVRPNVRVDIWSDVVCPWCYLGKRRFERALADFEHRDEVEVVYHSFELDPRHPREEVVPKASMLAAKYQISEAEFQAMEDRLVGLAAAEGLEYKLDGSVIGNTFDAHRVLHLARERGLAVEVVERFFRAYFTEQRSVFDDESLADLAAEAGLDRDETVRVLKEGTYADAVRADAERGRALGANGVPFFVLADRYGISGAQPVETFAAALGRAYAAPLPK